MTILIAALLFFLTGCPAHFMSCARVTAIPLVSLCAGSQVADLEQETQFLWGHRRKEGIYFFFSFTWLIWEQTQTSWTFVFWQGQNTVLLLLNKLWPKIWLLVLFAFLKCDVTLFSVKKKRQWVMKLKTAGLDVLLLHECHYSSYH